MIKRPDCACFNVPLQGTQILVGDFKSNAIANDMYHQFRALMNHENICPPAVSFMAIETITFILRGCALTDCGFTDYVTSEDDLAKMSARFNEMVAALPALLLECDAKMMAMIESRKNEGRCQ